VRLFFNGPNDGFQDLQGILKITIAGYLPCLSGWSGTSKSGFGLLISFCDSSG